VHWIIGKDLANSALDMIPPRRLVAPANVIECTAACDGDADFLLTPAAIAVWEAQHGALNQEVGCFCRTAGRAVPTLRGFSRSRRTPAIR